MDLNSPNPIRVNAFGDQMIGGEHRVAKLSRRLLHRFEGELAVERTKNVAVRHHIAFQDDTVRPGLGFGGE